MNEICSNGADLLPGLNTWWDDLPDGHFTILVITNSPGLSSV